MEQDTRIGLAMGILLIGIVGALFFRNEPASEEVPEIADAESLDDEIAERPIAPYLTRRNRADEQLDEGSSAADRPEMKAWTLPEFLRQDETAAPPTTASIAPDPIPRERSPVISEPVPPADTIVPQEVVVTEQAPESRTTSPNANDDLTEYRVRSGDTLSDIAERFLGSSARYMEIYELNRGRLRTPHDLRVGRRILVPRRLQ